MSLIDLCWMLALALLLGSCIAIARSLRHMPDWQDRLNHSHATVYARSWDLVFWLSHHLKRAVICHGRRLWHLSRALLASALLAAVALVPVLAIAWLTRPDFAVRGPAISIGGLIWGAVVEGPGMADRVGRFAPDVDFTPPLIFAVVLVIADLAVCGLAMSGVVRDEPTSSALIGASFAAAADLVSFAIGVAAAAFPRYPLLDPLDKPPPSVADPRDPR